MAQLNKIDVMSIKPRTALNCHVVTGGNMAGVLQLLKAPCVWVAKTLLSLVGGNALLS
mgnify:CR=1 FL=1